MANLTPAQTAALRALVDRRDPWEAARLFHFAGGRRTVQRAASVTLHSLRRTGLITGGGYGADVKRGVKITPEGRQALPGADPRALRGLLELVSVDVPLNVIRYAWSWDERAAAEDWAVRTHLRASDNIIRVPPCPAHVLPYRA